MGFDDGRVIFDRPNNTYFPGDTVHGRLVFQQDKVKTFRGIYVKMKGYCDVHWTTTRTRTVNGKSQSYTVNHNSHEDYYEQKVYLIGSEHGEYHLNPGNHEFVFQCFIPPHCPSSYEGAHGHIRYQFKFVVDRIMKFDQEKICIVDVVAKKDLNNDPYCREPMEFEMFEAYCCWCMSAGSCEVTVRLPASGYCAGQTIPIDVNCANKSNVEIEDIKLELKEETVFRATHESDTKTENNTIAKIKKGPVPPNTSRNWTVEMEVPLMDVRNLDACQYIDVDYEFEVTVSPDGCHEDTSTSRRIVLGHIPLREYEGNGPPPEQMFNQPGMQQFPGLSPYPGGNSPYPGGNPPYPGGNPPFPGGNGPNPIYPGGNSPYPGPNSSLPTVSPYPGPDPPYPGGNPSYPGGNSPYPGANPTASPYPGPNPPYPGGNSGYPGVSPDPGFSMRGGDNNHKDGATMPLLPTGLPMPYPPTQSSPYQNASAPEPSTPDSIYNTPAYNPDYKEEKKPE